MRTARIAASDSAAILFSLSLYKLLPLPPTQTARHSPDSSHGLAELPTGP